jgi:hypothetical protein
MASALLSLRPIVGGRGCGLSKARGSESGTRGPSSRRQPSPRAGLGSCESGFRPAPIRGRLSHQRSFGPSYSHLNGDTPGTLGRPRRKRTTEPANRVPSLLRSSPEPTNREPHCALRSDDSDARYRQGAQGIDTEHRQAALRQTANDYSRKPGVSRLARPKRLTRRCRWRSLDDRNWRLNSRSVSLCQTTATRRGATRSTPSPRGGTGGCPPAP